MGRARSSAACILVAAAALRAPPLASAGSDLRLDGGSDLGWDEEGSGWYVQVDGVMGGRSTGTLSFASDDGGDGSSNPTTMVFSGNINMIGGGFSSVRRDLGGSVDLSGHAGIVVEVEAQGAPPRAEEGQVGRPRAAPLGLHLQLNDDKPFWGFAAAFAIPFSSDALGRTASVFLPMDSFDRGSSSGMTCSDCSLDSSSVNGLDLYVLFQEGEFEARIRSITAVLDDPRPLPMPPIAFGLSEDVADLLRSTIKSGSSLYDKGYRELCISIYWSTLSSVVAASVGVDEATKGVACAGLLQSLKEEGKVEKAWTLRYTIDAMLADLQGLDREGSHLWLPDAAEFTNRAAVCSGTTSAPSRREDIIQAKVASTMTNNSGLGAVDELADGQE